MKERKLIVTIIFLTGLVFGSFLGEVLGKFKYLAWLNYGKQIGIPHFEVDLYAVNFSFGLTFNCTIACVLGLILALVFYRVIK